ncbi:T9SS type A sorting domain-containing protein [candidate division WOR-3 bacterium]|nr:T9SS type A sorting domain-containing protein [candidate division WOR-3 bacterium]
MMRLLIFTTVFVAAVSIPVSASIINVPDDCSTIQEGIDASSDGDTVLVQPDTYVENINLNGHNIILGSLFLTTGDTSYISSTIIDGDSSGTVVTFAYEEDSTAVITGFTIQNGVASSGGGIYCHNSSPSLENVTISGNTAGRGGGIYCTGSSPILTNVNISGNRAPAPWVGASGGIWCDNSSSSLENVVISGNTATFPWVGYGGGICCENSSPTLVNVTISGNTAGRGGGIYCTGSSPSLTNVTISGNTAYRRLGGAGGGIYCRANSSPSLVNVTISGNDGDDAGGGISCFSSSPSLENVTISGNAAESGGGICCRASSPSLTNVTISENSAYGGGGIYCMDNSSPSLTNVTISENNARYGGGFYCKANSSPSLTNVTISGNTATLWDGAGGGIYCRANSSPSLTNVTISENIAEEGGGFYCRNTSSPSLTNVTISENTAEEGGGFYCCDTSSPSLVNCILWNDTPQEIYIFFSGQVYATYSDIQGGWTGTGNIDEDPMFVSGPLGDYHLCPFTPSPCIDAGNPDPMYNDPENPLIPGYAMWPALGTVRNDMGVYGGPNTDIWIGVEEDEDLLPNTFLLIKTYPNPFSTKMTIDIRLQTTDQNQRSSVSGHRSSVCIYDITGRLIHTIPLNLCNLNKSVQSVIWDGRDNSGKKVPSGVYFLKFDAGEYSVTKKLLKVR